MDDNVFLSNTVGGGSLGSSGGGYVYQDLGFTQSPDFDLFQFEDITPSMQTVTTGAPSFQAPSFQAPSFQAPTPSFFEAPSLAPPDLSFGVPDLLGAAASMAAPTVEAAPEVIPETGIEMPALEGFDLEAVGDLTQPTLELTAPAEGSMSVTEMILAQAGVYTLNEQGQVVPTATFMGEAPQEVSGPLIENVVRARDAIGPSGMTIAEEVVRDIPGPATRARFRGAVPGGGRMSLYDVAESVTKASLGGYLGSEDTDRLVQAAGYRLGDFKQYIESDVFYDRLLAKNPDLAGVMTGGGPLFEPLPGEYVPLLKDKGAPIVSKSEVVDRLTSQAQTGLAVDTPITFKLPIYENVLERDVPGVSLGAGGRALSSFETLGKPMAEMVTEAKDYWSTKQLPFQVASDTEIAEFWSDQGGIKGVGKQVGGVLYKELIAPIPAVAETVGDFATYLWGGEEALSKRILNGSGSAVPVSIPPEKTQDIVLAQKQDEIAPAVVANYVSTDFQGPVAPESVLSKRNIEVNNNAITSLNVTPETFYSSSYDSSLSYTEFSEAVRATGSTPMSQEKFDSLVSESMFKSLKNNVLEDVKASKTSLANPRLTDRKISEIFEANPRLTYSQRNSLRNDINEIAEVGYYNNAMRAAGIDVRNGFEPEASVLAADMTVTDLEDRRNALRQQSLKYANTETGERLYELSLIFDDALRAPDPTEFSSLVNSYASRLFKAGPMGSTEKGAEYARNRLEAIVDSYKSLNGGKGPRQADFDTTMASMTAEIKNLNTELLSLGSGFTDRGFFQDTNRYTGESQWNVGNILTVVSAGLGAIQALYLGPKNQKDYLKWQEKQAEKNREWQKEMYQMQAAFTAGSAAYKGTQRGTPSAAAAVSF